MMESMNTASLEPPKSLSMIKFVNFDEFILKGSESLSGWTVYLDPRNLAEKSATAVILIYTLASTNYDRAIEEDCN